MIQARTWRHLVERYKQHSWQHPRKYSSLPVMYKIYAFDFESIDYTLLTSSVVFIQESELSAKKHLNYLVYKLIIFPESTLESALMYLIPFRRIGKQKPFIMLVSHYYPLLKLIPMVGLP